MLIDLHSRAEEDLSYIRKAMARAEGMSTVSGRASMVMGCLALITGGLAFMADDLEGQLKFWLYVAPIAAVIGIIGSALKSRGSDAKPLRDPASRFLLCLVPPISIAAITTHALWGSPYVYLLPGLWMLCYGCGLLAAGTYAVRPVAIMGACFLMLGGVATTLTDDWMNAAMSFSFGFLHIIFGWQLVRHHGG